MNSYLVENKYSLICIRNVQLYCLLLQKFAESNMDRHADSDTRVCDSQSGVLRCRDARRNDNFTRRSRRKLPRFVINIYTGFKTSSPILGHKNVNNVLFFVQFNNVMYNNVLTNFYWKLNC